MSDSLTVETLAALIMKAGHSHHEAYMDSDGIDPEWALWYSGFLQANLFGLVEKIPTRSALIHMLVQGEKDHPVDVTPEWPAAYAADMLPQITGAA